jgi:TrmH family RNA methyltransferase
MDEESLVENRQSMVNKSRLKFYASLKDRGARAESGLFLAEGRRIVEEGLKSTCACEAAFVREGFFGQDEETDRLLSDRNVEVLDEREFRRLSDTLNPQGIIGVFEYRSLLATAVSGENAIALFDLADPRNMGTIIRSADWFGLRELVVGETCVDVFNGKAVRSTMGSIFHCRFLLAADLAREIAALKPEYRVVTADLGGVDYRERARGGKSLFVFSNEARGPSEAILALSDEIVTIPGDGRAESLNVSCAAAVIMASVR